MSEALKDSVVLLARFPLPTLVGLGIVLMLLFRAAGPRDALLRLTNGGARGLDRPASLLVLGAFLLFGTWYVLQAGFVCEVEPMVTSVAWHVQNGGPLYHAPDDAARYSVLYGPSVYLATGFFLKLFGPSIPAAKFGALLALSLTLLLVDLAARRHVRGRTALAMTAFTALVIWMSGTSAFVVRPDPYLMLGVALGVFCAEARDRRLAAIGAALAFAFTVNLKIHGGLYFLPVFALLEVRHGWRQTVAAIVLAHVGVVAPFVLHPGISPRLYVEWVLLSLHHGLHTEFLPALLGRGTFMALPALVLLAAGARFPDGSRLEKRLGLAWITGNLAVLILALKPGAGLVHMLPLVPVNALFAALLWADFRRRAPAPDLLAPHVRRAALTAFALTALLCGSVTGYRSGRMTQELLTGDRELAMDVHEILATSGGRTIAMGYGGEGPYFHRTYMRPLLTFAQQPLVLDAIAQMDAQRADLALPDEALEAFDSGTVDVWLIPAGQRPFDKRNWYAPHEPIFPPDYVARFLANYERTGRSRYFDLWEWRGVRHAGAAGAPAGDGAP